MAIKRAQNYELQARLLVPDADQCAFASLGNLLSNSVKNGIKSLRSSKSSVNKSNVLSSSAGHLSRMEFLSEDKLHSIQKFVPLTTKLRASRSDIQKILNQDPRKKGKRHSQNGLR
jgi:hypothetical protein